MLYYYERYQYFNGSEPPAWGLGMGFKAEW
jgi:hypothetical protein